ncbi:MAG: hypothetical protein E2O56_07440 [Gammaproteobacteria bacterium]|nr:MAG: hypothetical protein E2O56_07440 [Gammaproteobacteria bacterium]
MKQTRHSVVAGAITRMLRPLVRFLLRAGVSYGAFADFARWVYVDVAMKEFGISGRKQTKSRVSVLTGLTRRQVDQVMRDPPPHEAAEADRYNRAARVLTAWTDDSRFLDPEGHPLELPLEETGDGASFNDLVRAASAETPPRAILDELRNAGAISISGTDTVKLEKAYYIPTTSEAEKLDILGMSTADLISTIDKNFFDPEQEEALFQRVVYNLRIRPSALPEIRKRIREILQEVADDTDRFLYQVSDRPTQVDPEQEYKRAGIGLYYFES